MGRSFVQKLPLDLALADAGSKPVYRCLESLTGATGEWRLEVGVSEILGGCCFQRTCRSQPSAFPHSPSPTVHLGNHRPHSPRTFRSGSGLFTFR